MNSSNPLEFVIAKKVISGWATTKSRTYSYLHFTRNDKKALKVYVPTPERQEPRRPYGAVWTMIVPKFHYELAPLF